MNSRGNLERFADLNILAISIADLNIKNAHLRPIFAHPRFPFAKLGCGGAVIAREFLVSSGRGSVKTLGIFLDHPMRVENRSDAADRSTHQLKPRQRQFSVWLGVIKGNDLVFQEMVKDAGIHLAL